MLAVHGQAPICASCPPTIREELGSTTGCPHHSTTWLSQPPSVASRLPVRERDRQTDRQRQRETETQRERERKRERESNTQG